MFLRCTLGHDKYPLHFKSVFNQYTPDNTCILVIRGGGDSLTGKRHPLIIDMDMVRM